MATKNGTATQEGTEAEQRRSISHRDDFGDDRRFRKLVLSIALTLLLGCGVFAIALTPVFSVKTITVSGVTHYPEQAVREVSGVSSGINAFEYLGNIRNILTLRNHQASELLLQKFPWFQSADVRFRLPSGFEIQVREREAFMQTESGAGYIVFDKEGTAVDFSRKTVDKVPVVKGFKSPGKPGDRLNGDDLLRLDDLIHFMKATEWSNAHDKPDMTGLISQIDVTDVSGLRFIYDGRISVILGSSDQFDYRLAMFKRIVSTNIQKSEKGILDFVSGDSPVFRPQQN